MGGDHIYGIPGSSLNGMMEALKNDAIRTAFQYNGVAVVILHNDYMEEEIDYEPTHGEFKEIPNLKHFEIEDSKIKSIVDEIKKAKKPMLYLGRGVDEYMNLAI